jgi:hypothetical protein
MVLLQQSLRKVLCVDASSYRGTKFTVLWQISRLCFVKAFLQTIYSHTLICQNFGTDTACRRRCSYVNFCLQIFTSRAGLGRWKKLRRRCCNRPCAPLVMVSI